MLVYVSLVAMQVFAPLRYQDEAKPPKPDPFFNKIPPVPDNLFFFKKLIL